MPPILKDRRVLAGVLVAVAILAGWLLLRAPALDTATVTAQAIRETLQLTGRVVTRDRVTLAAQITGTVQSIAVEAGDRVRAGQLLLTIDNPEVTAAARQADAALAQAKARLAKIRDIDRVTARADAERARIEHEQAARQVENLKPLLAAQSIGAEQFRAAQETLALKKSFAEAAQLRAKSLDGGRDWQLAEADVAQAEAARAVAAARLSYAGVRAPAAGLILARRVDPGAQVQAGLALLDFVPVADVEVRIDVDERFLNLLRPAQAVKIIADAYPEIRLDGSVVRIAPQVDADRGTVEVRVAITAPPDWLREDMTTSVEVLVGEKASVAVIPVAAVMDQNSKPWAWCVQDGRLARCNLTLGLRDDKFAEVVSGATPGTVVIAIANKALKEGSRVKTRALSP